MQVEPLKSNNPSFDGIRIKQSGQYKTMRIFCEKNDYKSWLNHLKQECNRLEDINMDLYIHEGKDYPQFLEEIKDEIDISNTQLYNETIEKIFGRTKYSADVFIAPSNYTAGRENTKEPIRYYIPKLRLQGNYIADKWINKLRYSTFPQSHDPEHKYNYSYFDIPLPEMILDIKKKIFNSILESNVQLANNSKHL